MNEDIIILVVSHDPARADTRKRTLLEAGYSVREALNLLQVKEACSDGNIQMALVGYSIPPAEQRRVINFLREQCSVPIIQLFQNGEHTIISSTGSRTFTDSPTPDDFLQAVQYCLRECD